MSTKVSYIHGPSQAIPKGKANKRFVDYSKMTSGELRLTLIAEQLNIMAQYYGRDEYKALEQRVLTAVNTGISGIHTIGTVTGQLGRRVEQEIIRARRMIKPAAGSFSIPRNSVNGLVPLQNCDDLREFVEDDYGQGWGQWEDTNESRECERKNRHLMMLNDHLEGSAHHMLYEYLAAGSQGVPAAKSVLHRNAVSKLADITEVERENLRLWLRNGVMRNNVSNGTAPLQPQQVIDTLAASVGDSSVGGAFLAALPAIISAITAAVGATAALIQHIQANKRQQLLNVAQGIGTSTWGPGQQDWAGYQHNSNNPQQPGNDPLGGGLLEGDNLPYLLLGGAALMMLK